MAIARLAPTRVRCDLSKGILVSINAFVDMNFWDYPINSWQSQIASTYFSGL
jgi:hypothetical protein